jgi:cephalosporin-C deacetylase-like acetyl esterase
MSPTLVTRVIRRSAPLGFILLVVGMAFGQKPLKAEPGDAMIEAYLARETDRLSERVFDGATSRAEWEARRPRLKQEYFEMLGLWPLPEKTPLHATVTGTVDRAKEGVVIEKLHFQSKPGLYVTGNLYRPRESKGRLPAVLYVCGHSGKGRDGNKTAFQHHGVWFASHGFVCLIIDTLQLGEIPGIHHGTYKYDRWWWQARGYTPAGVECWNGVRAIDYLVSRPDVDPERIAVTGISGGGAATFWIAAADERVKCAVPVSGMSDLKGYVKDKVINGHCDCMFLINTYQWEWTAIAALVAPRPLLFCNSDEDKIFPMDGNRRIMERLRTLYQWYGKPDLVDEYVSHGGHEDRPDLRVAACQWINKHLRGDTAPAGDVDAAPLPGPELRVFPEDKDVPTDALNGKIDETFVPKAEVKLPEAGKFEEWKKGLTKELREKSFRTFPDRIPVAKASGEFQRYETAAVKLSTEHGVEVASMLIPKRGAENSKQAWLLVANPGEDLAKLGPRISSIVDDDAFLLLPRGVVEKDREKSLLPDQSWTSKSPPNYVERAHALLGRTVDQGRVWDIAATARYLGKDGRRLKIIGRGQAGILAAYAAHFEPSISEVIIVDPPVSHRDGPIFLNVLRVLDVPEALGLLAPRPLTLVNAKDRAFERTAEIYRRAGAETKLSLK